MTQHDVESVRFKKGPRQAFSPYSFAKTLTCSGGIGNYHWDGERLYTIREAACLQTFPTIHVFSEGRTKARRQIGNAVPPLLARLMFKEIIKSLKAVDAAEAAEAAN